MPHKDDLNRLYHIWEAATEAMLFVKGKARDDFDQDRLLQHGLVRLLEIIGEAAANISPAFRQTYDDIPWGVMVGMRNRLIHAYFNIDLDVVWRTVNGDLALLTQTIEPILRDEGII